MVPAAVVIAAAVVVAVSAGWDIAGWLGEVWKSLRSISLLYLVLALALQTLQTAVATAAGTGSCSTPTRTSRFPTSASSPAVELLRGASRSGARSRSLGRALARCRGTISAGCVFGRSSRYRPSRATSPRWIAALLLDGFDTSEGFGQLLLWTAPAIWGVVVAVVAAVRLDVAPSVLRSISAAVAAYTGGFLALLTSVAINGTGT